MKRNVTKPMTRTRTNTSREGRTSYAGEMGASTRVGRTQRVFRLTAWVAGSLLVTSAAFASGGEERSQGEILKEMGWQALNLAILLGVLFHFGRKPIRDFFATRRSGIQSELSQAAELLRQAEQRNSELQRRLVDLNSEVEAIKTAASERASDEADRILEEARATAERIRTDARAAIAQELRRAQSELREEAADLALELAAKKLEEEISTGDRDRLVDEFIVRVEPGAADSAGGANR